MDAGKTLDLLKVAYNYNDRGQETLILTSSVDKRAGENKVKSRVGFDKDATSTSLNDDLFKLVETQLKSKSISCVLVDEIQFFSMEQVNQLSDVVDYLHVPVICYGLRSDYCGRPFAASAQLLAIADSIEELKTICHCGRKATFNMLVRSGVAVTEGVPVVVDDDSLKQEDTLYTSVCRLHWKHGTWRKST